MTSSLWKHGAFQKCTDVWYRSKQIYKGKKECVKTYMKNCPFGWISIKTRSFEDLLRPAEKFGTLSFIWNSIKHFILDNLSRFSCNWNESSFFLKSFNIHIETTKCFLQRNLFSHYQISSTTLINLVIFLNKNFRTLLNHSRVSRTG